MEKSGKKHRIGVYLATFGGVAAILLLVAYFSLPYIVERWAIPRAARAFGVELESAEVRHLGVGSADLSDLVISGAPGGGKFKLASARVDYKLGFDSLEITRVALTGADLEIELTADNQFKLAGRTAGEWMAAFSSGDRAEKERGDGGGFAFRVGKLELTYSQLKITAPDFSWTVPVRAEIMLPSPENRIVHCEFRLDQARDFISGTLTGDATTGQTLLELKSSFSVQRYLQLFTQTRDLPISGVISAGISGEFNREGGKAELSFGSRRLRYGEVDIALNGKWLLDCLDGRRTLTGGDGFSLELSSPLFKLGFHDFKAEFSNRMRQWKMSFGIDWEAMKFVGPALRSELQADFDGKVAASGALETVADPDFRLYWTVATGDNGISATVEADSPAGYVFPLQYGDGFSGGASGIRLRGEFSGGADGFRADCVLSAARTTGGNSAGLSMTAQDFKAGLHWPASESGMAAVGVGAVAINGVGPGIHLSGAEAAVVETGGVPGVRLRLGELSAAGFPVGIKSAEILADLSSPGHGAPPVWREWNIFFTGDMRAEGRIAATDTGWLLEGAGRRGEQAGFGPTISVSIDYLPNFLAAGSLIIPETALDGTLLAELFPALSGWELDGNVSGSAEYKYGFGNNQGRAAFKLSGVGAANSELKLAADNLNAEIKLPNLPRLLTSETQTLTCEKFTFNGIALDDLYVKFQLLSRELFIDQAGLKAFGGDFTVYALHLREGVGNVEANILCDGLKLSEFINTFGFAEASGDGRIFGRIPVSYGRDGIFVKRGFLYSEPGVAETLRLDGFGGVDLAGSGSAELDLAQEALKNFVYDWVKIELDQENDDRLLMTATFNGKPAGNLPFTFDQNAGGFARVDYAGAHFQGINLTLRWRIPLNQLLQLNQTYGKLKERFNQ